MSAKYCKHCGRVAHRCHCADEASALRQFFERGNHAFQAERWMAMPYKRGVPPQIKRRERNTLRRHYAEWFAALSATYGATCANCDVPLAEEKLVIDHVLPIAKGGQSIYENLQLLCGECNRIKGKLYIDCRTD